MVWFGEDLKDYLVLTALPQDGQGYLPLDKLLKAPSRVDPQFLWDSLFQCLSTLNAVFQVNGKVEKPNA